MSNSEKNFLDYNGLSHYDENIKEYIPITHGYYNNGNFYSDSSFTELITGEEKRLYVDLAENGLYEYKNNEYVPFSGGGGTTNYNNLSNKPQINSVELSGNKSLNDLGIAADNHTHNIDLAADSGTSELDLSADTKYKLSAGGESFIFKTPPTPSASDVGAIASSLKGTANGVAELDANGFVPSAQLPSFVDDIIEGYLYDSKFYKESTHTTEITGETGKVYVDLATDTTYRWSGTAFVQIKGDLALGETSSTAYRGDRGKIAYDHSQATHARTDATKTEASATNGNIKINGTETTVYTHPGSGTNPHGTTASDVGLGNVGNFKAVSTIASQGLTDTEKSNARANIGAGTSSLTIGSTASTAAAGNHTHTTSLATDSGTATVTLARNTTYKLTAGGTNVIFKTPASDNTDTKNTAGSTDTSSKIFLIGATSQAANPQTYSDNQVYTTSGTLTSNKLSSKALIALTGSGTAGSTSGTTQKPTKWTFNSGLTVANGEVYFIKIPTAGGTYGVWLSLNNGTNYYPVAIGTGKGRFTTHYSANTVIAVTYESVGVCTCYPLAGGTATSDVTGIFRVLNDYDANTTYSAMSSSELTTGTATTSRVVRADYLKTGINSLITAKGYISDLSGTDTGNKLLLTTDEL